MNEQNEKGREREREREGVFGGWGVFHFSLRLMACVSKH